jgi:ankyrin repeat protein
VRRHQTEHCPLALAVAKNHTDVVQCLLDAGADPSKIGPTGQTALHVGASCNSLEATKLLLSYSTVEVKTKDNQV